MIQDCASSLHPWSWKGSLKLLSNVCCGGYLIYDGIYKACISKLVCPLPMLEDEVVPSSSFSDFISWTGGGFTIVIGTAKLSVRRPFISLCSWHRAHQCRQQCVMQGSHGEFLRWYFFCKDWRTSPVYMPHIHHVNNNPSQMRNVVFGSMQWSAAVAVAKAMPPSTNIAWQTHGLVQSISSSLKLSTLRPNKTHGQNSPVQQLCGSSAQPKIPVVQGSSAGGSKLSGSGCPHSLHFLTFNWNLARGLQLKMVCFLVFPRIFLKSSYQNYINGHTHNIKSTTQKTIE